MAEAIRSRPLIATLRLGTLPMVRCLTLPRLAGLTVLMVALHWLVYGLLGYWLADVAPLWLFAALTSALVVTVGLLVLVTLRSWIRGPSRMAATGWLLLGLAPLWCSGLCFAHVWYRATERASLDLNFPLRAIAGWACSVMDAEALWTKPRRTQGQHVVLYDDGTIADAQRLVTEMDTHIRQMAKLLGRQPASTKARWVRGRLLGEGGRAIWSWGLCDAGAANELTYVDRHELAHVTITLLASPRQHPAMLLAEGWAQYQSVDRDALIANLIQQRCCHANYELASLLGPTRYGASIGPAYDHGGPFVVWLIETYGGPKFLELYAALRPDNVEATFRATTGRSLAHNEQAFWQWLDTQQSAAPDVDLAEGVSRDVWQQLLQRYAVAQVDQPFLPRNTAWFINCKRDHKTQGGTQTRQTTYRWRCDGRGYFRYFGSDDQTVTGVAYTEGGVICATRYGEQVVRNFRTSLPNDARQTVRSQLDGLHDLSIDPRRVLLQSSTVDSRRTIISVEPPDAETDLWTIVEEWSHDSELPTLWQRYQIDPRQRYWATSFENRLVGPPPSDDPEVVATWTCTRAGSFQFIELGNWWWPILVDYSVIGPGNYHMHTTVTSRALTEVESAEIEQQLDAMALELTVLPLDPWWLRHEWALAAAWPALALVLLRPHRSKRPTSTDVAV